MANETTVVLTDIKEALSSSEKEAAKRPACLLVVGGELNGTLFDLTEKLTTIVPPVTPYLLNLEVFPGYILKLKW